MKQREHLPSTGMATTKDERALSRLVVCNYILASLFALLALGYLGTSLVVAFKFGLIPFFFVGPLYAGLIFTLAYLNFRSAKAISARRGVHLSLFVAGLNCCFFPIGTLLGVYSWRVLNRPSVENLLSCRSDAIASETEDQKLSPELLEEAAKHLAAEEEMWKKIEEEHRKQQQQSKGDADLAR